MDLNFFTQVCYGDVDVLHDLRLYRGPVSQGDS
jgi:hypothetical protein